MPMVGLLVAPSQRTLSTGAGPARRTRRPTRRRVGVHWRRMLERQSARLPLVAGTYLSKLSVPPFGALGLALATPLMAAVAVGGFATGRMVLHARRAFAFALMVVVLLTLQIVAADHFSVGSLALLLV